MTGENPQGDDTGGAGTDTDVVDSDGTGAETERIDADGGLSSRAAVLVVDDDGTWARTAARLLERQRDRLSVTTATALPEAETAFERLDPDCVVCDYRLDDATGFEFLSTVRRVDPDRPFVLVTGEGDEGVASEAIRRGATDYVRKGRHSDDPELLAERVTSAIRAYRTRRALTRERRSKEAMLDIVTTTASRETLCQAFCDLLVDEHGYTGAWIGIEEGVDGLDPWAAVDCGGYLDCVGSALRAGDGENPALTARNRNEVCVVDRIGPDDPDAMAPSEGDSAGRTDDPDWRSAALAAGFRSVAAVPLGQEGGRVGVLTVFAAEPGAFDDRECRLLSDYAETIAYALRTASWKRSLVSSVPVSVEFRISGEEVPLVAFGRQLPDGTSVSVASTAVKSDRSLLYLLRVSDASGSAIPDATTVPGAESVRVDDDASPVRVELVADGPTPERLLANRGAKVTGTAVENDAVIVSVSYPREGDIQALSRALRDEFAEVEVGRIRADESGAEPVVDKGLAADLTDKQRQALETAYHQGYFEQPREHNATEIGDALGISRVTFTQHLRTAERKVFARLFDPD
ncbi:helix-turn-helix domain-containing protein [Halosimplex rubrum]|uniref:Helix-turn-helix domain-containing protein n=1 Tax=Halosimplex rubrum TaxID=869889 RepID=A0A7D5T4J3_9EURY|nr:helix-turn-helix domain-containing protein [Halosimplex rubrum]QLH76933.1 helix-turn-helix domain-containing protein [Halosimplex rubrum]